MILVSLLRDSDKIGCHIEITMKYMHIMHLVIDMDGKESAKGTDDARIKQIIGILDELVIGTNQYRATSIRTLY
jgi:hypothetical protein